MSKQLSRRARFAELQAELVTDVVMLALADKEIDRLLFKLALKMTLPQQLAEYIQETPLQKVSEDFPIDTESFLQVFAVGVTVPYSNLLAKIILLILERVPQLQHAYGPRLGEFVIFIACRIAQDENLAQGTGVAQPDPPRPRLYRYLPDNPIVLAVDGSLRCWENARPEHFQQMIDGHSPQSRVPRKNAGRGKGQYTNLMPAERDTIVRQIVDWRTHDGLSCGQIVNKMQNCYPEAKYERKWNRQTVSRYLAYGLNLLQGGVTEK